MRKTRQSKGLTRGVRYLSFFNLSSANDHRQRLNPLSQVKAGPGAKGLSPGYRSPSGPGNSYGQIRRGFSITYLTTKVVRGWIHAGRGERSWNIVFIIEVLQQIPEIGDIDPAAVVHIRRIHTANDVVR